MSSQCGQNLPLTYIDSRKFNKYVNEVE